KPYLRKNHAQLVKQPSPHQREHFIDLSVVSIASPSGDDPPCEDGDRDLSGLCCVGRRFRPSRAVRTAAALLGCPSSRRYARRFLFLQLDRLAGGRVETRLQLGSRQDREIGKLELYEPPHEWAQLRVVHQNTCLPVATGAVSDGAQRRLATCRLHRQNGMRAG